ncbi:putative phosphohistidine phosphatase SixA [Leptospira ryugenii]|uniref:Putative phosphohistidine phosphatase SixA n=1 Tax=Leptospira ryugenii TaxID=1917863 RepID=A0A2P2E418_9LEPT|nr:histidine phosphatase family protein [Leptospira ryugenii]GBF51628.1 putative phosphohistidine phosphatase SixA [Leptospira ryugenii]
MKHLYLLRHAKSDWDEAYESDEERNLSDRGKKQTKALRNFLLDFKFQIDLAYVSPAVRTERTYHALRKDMIRLPKPEFKPAIYEADAEDLLFLVHGVPEYVRSVLIVGHNPGLEEFATGLLRGNPERSLFSKFPTSALVGLQFAANTWKEVEWGKAALTLFWIPGQLGKE